MKNLIYEKVLQIALTKNILNIIINIGKEKCKGLPELLILPKK